MRTPTWGEIEQFVGIDGGWEPTDGKKHVFYEKTLPDGRVLNTHVSHGRDKSMHPRTFSLICRTQLGVRVDEFWKTLENGRSARSGAAAEEPPKPPSLAMLRELKRKLHLTDNELVGMTLDEAKRRLDGSHSRPFDLARREAMAYRTALSLIHIPTGSCVCCPQDATATDPDERGPRRRPGAPRAQGADE